MSRLEFFFDCSSPWTYLALHRVQVVAAETGAQLPWRPILVGGVFDAVNPAFYEARGGFGSPTFFVDGQDMYFGSDRLDLVRDALRTSRSRVVAGSPSPEVVRHTIEQHCKLWNERRREDRLALCTDDISFDDPVGVQTKYGRTSAWGDRHQHL